MGFFCSIPLFIECFKLAKWSGVRARFRFMIGALILEDLYPKGSVFPVCGSDAHSFFALSDLPKIR